MKVWQSQPSIAPLNKPQILLNWLMWVHSFWGGPRCQAGQGPNGRFVGYRPFAEEGCSTSPYSLDSSSTLAPLGHLSIGKGSPALRLSSAGDSWVRRCREVA